MNKDVQKIIDFLGCECEFIEGGKHPNEIMRIYYEALKQGKAEGFTPIFLVLDEYLIQDFGLGETAEEFHKRISEAEPFDAENWFEKRVAEYAEYGGVFDFDVEIPDELAGAMEEFGPFEQHEFIGPFNHSTNLSEDILLAKIPVTNPWEIFAYVPFGGWNECPSNEELMQITKYWYEKHGAEPVVITHDILEFLAAPVENPEEAKKLAREMYIFCVDIVDQGVQSVAVLEEIVKNSTVWYFWWD